MSGPRVSIVVLTYNRCDEVLRTVGALARLPDDAPIIVVDNGSRDGTVERLHAAYPTVQVIASPANLGAAARNLGVEAARTPYVAFCDDDTCWEPHAVEHAADLLDACPDVAVVCGRVLVGDEGLEDPTCTAMAQSVLGQATAGMRLLGFLAGASVMRIEAFRAAGGYEPRLFIGGEEALLAFDFAAHGWLMIYCDSLVTRHFPSAARDARGRQHLLLRNAIWVAWMRLPWRDAWTETRVAVARMRAERILWPTAWASLRGLAWALSRRRVVPEPVRAMWRALRQNEITVEPTVERR
jgi:GT2 family glycosyltransferase